MTVSFQKLSIDPNGHCINCCSFQQDAVVTFGEYQYVVLYVPVDAANGSTSGSVDAQALGAQADGSGPRVTSIGRRAVGTTKWEFVFFQDYVQTKDDGHNVISLGISGDGVIHLAWDMHGDEIHYRQSVQGLAASTGPAWSVSSFSPVLTQLPAESGAFVFDEITYPRFQSLPSGDLLLEFRVGRSGLGDCAIYRYSCQSSRWSSVRTPYIRGVANNAYLHGLDYRAGRVHVLWTYRDYVDDRTGDSTDGPQETSQAGPNGPENNHDLHYMYSPDEGVSWYNTHDQELLVPVDVSLPTLVVEIEKYAGIMNQEAQCVDPNNGVHVLGRAHGKYYHYFRLDSGDWAQETVCDLPAVLMGRRGKLVARGDFLYALLPGLESEFRVLRSQKSAGTGERYGPWTEIFALNGFDGEPLVDRYSSELWFLQREDGDRRDVLIGHIVDN